MENRFEVKLSIIYLNFSKKIRDRHRIFFEVDNGGHVFQIAIYTFLPILECAKGCVTKKTVHICEQEGLNEIEELQRKSNKAIIDDPNFSDSDQRNALLRSMNEGMDVFKTDLKGRCTYDICTEGWGR